MKEFMTEEEVRSEFISFLYCNENYKKMYLEDTNCANEEDIAKYIMNIPIENGIINITFPLLRADKYPTQTYTRFSPYIGFRDYFNDKYKKEILEQSSIAKKTFCEIHKAKVSQRGIRDEQRNN